MKVLRRIKPSMEVSLLAQTFFHIGDDIFRRYER